MKMMGTNMLAIWNLLAYRITSPWDSSCCSYNPVAVMLIFPCRIVFVSTFRQQRFSFSDPGVALVESEPLVPFPSYENV